MGNNWICDVMYLPDETVNINTICIDLQVCGFACRQQDTFCTNILEVLRVPHIRV